MGQTGRTLRERLLSLAAGVNAAECPFNNPHTTAPHLCLLRRLDGRCPARVLLRTGGGRRESPSRHRVEAGLSTEANHGSFYPRYARPTNR